MRFFLSLALTAAGLYLVVLGLVFFFQRSLLYPASGLRASAGQAGLGGIVEDVVIEAHDGERLVAWWRPPQPGRAVVLYFHGNGGGLSDRRDRARLLTQDGRGLLLVSYRGYSGSTGTPTEAGLSLDASAAFDWVARRYEKARIVLYGESLGSGLAVPLATGRSVGGLVLDAPFTSAADVASAVYWFLPVRLLMRDQYRSLERIGDLRAPLLVLHGDRDGVVPFALGERLYGAAPEPKRFVRIPGGGHADNLERPEGQAAVRAFLTEVEARMPHPPASAVDPPPPAKAEGR